MIKYISRSIVFQEIPDEITLALEITNCPHNCPNCHSPELRKNIGTILVKEELDLLIKSNPYISCVCFMGGDNNHKEIVEWTKYIHKNYNLKVAMYSGDDNIDLNLFYNLDYYKIGSYKEELGPLNKKTTNQKLYRIINKQPEDITYRFWK